MIITSGNRRTSLSAPKHCTISKKISKSSAAPVWSPSKKAKEWLHSVWGAGWELLESISRPSRRPWLAPLVRDRGGGGEFGRLLYLIHVWGKKPSYRSSRWAIKPVRVWINQSISLLSCWNRKKNQYNQQETHTSTGGAARWGLMLVVNRSTVGLIDWLF